MMLGGLLVCSLVGTAQDRPANDPGNLKTAVAAHGFGGASQRRLLGTVKTEDGKLVFASKFGNRVWTVMNPEALKGLEGEHVQVFAQVYRDSNSIRVLRVRTFTRANPGTPPK